MDVRTIFKLWKDFFVQIRSPLFMKFFFPLSFLFHYLLKKIGILLYPFPFMKIKLYNCIFLTRKRSIDFWVTWKKWEEDITRWLLRKKRKGIFIDIGAHIGRYSILLAKNGWSVYSFEPLIQNFKILRFNARMNNVNLNAFNIAVGNTIRRASMFYTKGKFGEASLIKKQPISQTIYIDKIDNVLENISPRGEMILKIDVEGNEYNVILGAKKFIKKFRPIIIVEIWKEKGKKVINLLRHLGYRKFGFRWVYTKKINL